MPKAGENVDKVQQYTDDFAETKKRLEEARQRRLDEKRKQEVGCSDCSRRRRGCECTNMANSVADGQEAAEVHVEGERGGDGGGHGGGGEGPQEQEVGDAAQAARGQDSVVGQAEDAGAGQVGCGLGGEEEADHGGPRGRRRVGRRLVRRGDAQQVRRLLD